MRRKFIINPTETAPGPRFIYVRKSTDDQQRQVRFIDDQFAELASFRKTITVEVIHIFAEREIGKASGTTTLNETRSTVSSTGEANGILVASVIGFFATC